ncbi:MAG: hypothetical protein MJZ34_11085 [Paludibacteraceae bacterium]|nr:hypothetical protein [Paludibacteraceae bacterium]
MKKVLLTESEYNKVQCVLNESKNGFGFTEQEIIALRNLLGAKLNMDMKDRTKFDFTKFNHYVDAKKISDKEIIVRISNEHKDRMGRGKDAIIMIIDYTIHNENKAKSLSDTIEYVFNIIKGYKLIGETIEVLDVYLD